MGLYFFRNTENKKELFLFLSSQIQVFQKLSTWGKVLLKLSLMTFQFGDHEEADKRVHALHAAERGYGKIIIRTIDTDIILIMLYHLPALQICHLNIKLFVSFGVGKSFQILDLE